jgi:hypothetical protein
LHQRRIAARLIAIAVSIAVLASTKPASAQQPSPPSPLLPPAGVPMTLTEFQAFSCAGAGAVAGISALGYVDPITVFTAGPGTPLLLIPVFFAGFTVGCSIGATLGPAFLWMYRHAH